MQLVAYGAQDIFLTGNPQITFFKVVYRRHTNFSIESIEQTFHGTPDFGTKVSCTVSRTGDLIHSVLLRIKLKEVKHQIPTKPSGLNVDATGKISDVPPTAGAGDVFANDINGAATGAQLSAAYKDKVDKHGVLPGTAQATAVAGVIQANHTLGSDVKIQPTYSLDEERWIRWTNYLGHAIIKYVEVEIGGQKIDKQYGEWMHIWNQLTLKSGHESGYGRMMGNIPELVLPRTNLDRIRQRGGLQDYSVAGGALNTLVQPTDVAGAYIQRQFRPERTIQPFTLNIPLQFWFCRNPGLALPLIALQYHEVKFNIEFNALSKCLLQYKMKDPHNATADLAPDFVEEITKASDGSSVMEDATLFIDYIYLDDPERRRFAQLAHEYLIEQVQFTGEDIITGASNNKIKLAFNHPVKELVWVVQKRNVSDNKQWFNYTTHVDPDIFTGDNQMGNHLGEAIADMMTIKLNSNFEAKTNGTSDVYTAPTLVTVGTASLDNDDTGVFGTGFDNLTLNTDGNLSVTLSGKQHDPWNDDAKVGIRKSHNNINTKNNCKSAKIQLNGQDRFVSREGDYFNYVQPYNHHSRTPAPGINVYSFALRPEEHQPSGTCNFSRIDNATLLLSCQDDTMRSYDIVCKEGKFVTRPRDGTTTTNQSAAVRVYATNYNVLRIMSGMGGLAYSN